MKHKDVDSSVLMRKTFGFKAEAVNDDGTFNGYGSVFGNVDSYNEIVAPGAFAKSLKAIAKSGDPLPALWQHRSGEPIGGYDLLEEDKRGLKVEGFLVLEDPVAKRAHLYMKRRIVKGLSIGYYVIKSSYDEETNIRTLIELELVEISIVTFPANAEAQIDNVKSQVESGKLPTLPEFEKHLREVCGFSKSQATAIAGGGLSKLLRSESDATKSSASVADLLANFKFLD